MKTNRIAALLTAAVLTAALAGCDRGPAPVTTTAPPPAETTAATQAPATTAAPSTDAATVPETTAPAPLLTAPELSVLMTTVEEISTLPDNPDVKLMTFRRPEIRIAAPNGAAELIQQELDNSMEAGREIAAEMLESAKLDYPDRSDWRGYSYEVNLTPRRVDTSVISFSGAVISFSGGVHPNQNLISISFDTLTGSPIVLEDLFPDGAASDTVYHLVMEHLSREEGLYPEYQDVVLTHFDFDNPVSGCFYLSSDGLVFYFSPYEIAPYARGPVEITIPYGELDGLMNSCWFPPAPPAASGSLQVVSDGQAQVTIPLDEGAPLVLLQASGDVSDLTVYHGKPFGMSWKYVPVYSAPRVSDGTCIAIALEPDTHVSISWRDSGVIQILDLVKQDSGYTLFSPSGQPN